MNALIKYFIKFPVAGNVIMILILIFGYFGLKELKKTFFPISESKNITISAVYPGSSPEEIEEGIVLKMEQSLKGISGIEEITSVSKENNGTVTVVVEKDFETDLVLQDVKNAVDRVSSFPDGMEPPSIVKREAISFAINFALSGDVDLKTLKKYAKQAESDLLAIDGISKISIQGYPSEEIEITFRENDLQAYQLTLDQATQAIRRSNLEITGGTVKGKSEEMLVRARSKKYYADELLDIIIKTTPDGKIVRLSDVANVQDIWSDNPNRSYMNGEPAVIVSLSNTNNEDIIYVADQTREYVANFNKRNDELKATIIRDGSITIRQRIELLTKNGLTGFVLVFVILTLFLNYRVAFWVAISIPISFAGMFIIAGTTDLTINVMSLFGMILVIGILVDDGIVIGENIYQQWEKGKAPLKAAIDGSMQVLPAVVSAVLTTVVAFSAFFFLDGPLGNFAPDLAFVVISTLLFSLVEGALILPAHIGYSKALRKEEKTGFDKTMGNVEFQMNKVMVFMRDRLYAPVFRATLKHKTLTVAIFLGLFIVTIGAIGGRVIETTFFPAIGSDNVSVNLQMPPGTRDYVTEEVLVRIEQAAREVNEDFKSQREDSLDVIEKIERKVGPGSNSGSISLRLLDSEIRDLESFVIANAVRDKVGPVPSADKLTFGGGTIFGKPISVSLLGNNLKELEAAKEALKDELRKITALKDVVDTEQSGTREINIKLKDKAYLLGLNLQQVVGQVRQGFFGSEVQRLQRGEDEVKVWVRYNEDDRNSIGKLENMRIRTANGEEFPFKEIASYTIERGVIAINHFNGKREVKVEAEMANPNESASAINSEVQSTIVPEVLANFPSVTYAFQGQSKRAAKTMDSVFVVLPIIGILMLAIVTLTFRSFLQAITIFIIIPLGIIGVGWGHYIHGDAISLLSWFGVIALIGVMVNDSLVLVSAMNENLKEGMNFKDSVYEAGRSRFRPILLTSLTTIAGLGPLIAEQSKQAQFLIPMAISVAYGLAIATLTTLFVLPALLMIMNDFRRGFSHFQKSWGGLKSGIEIPTPEEVEPVIEEKILHEMLLKESEEVSPNVSNTNNSIEDEV